MNDFTMAPAVLGTGRYFERTEKYNFVSTKNIVNVFEQNNWNVHSVSQVKNQARTQHKKDFSKHLISFANPALKEVNGIIPRIVVINSHDGSTKFQMMAGFFRFLCANGLIVADSTFEAISCRHQKLAPEIIEAGIERYLKVIPEITSKTEDMNCIVMNPIDRLNLANNVIERVWENTDVRPLQPAQLLETRREADNTKTLWTTYNVMQENLLQGGLTGKTANGRKRKTRAITSIDKELNLNQILWEESDKFLLAA